MAFTGYVFESSNAIKPYLEVPRKGPTSMFCCEVSKHLKCYVVCGYPEALTIDEHSIRPDGHGGVYHLAGANSAVLYGPDGNFIGNYRKTNLYTTDIPWAKEGDGFATYQLPPPLGKLTIAICKDLNSMTPDWTREDGPYELADYCLSEQINTVILCNAWLDSENQDDPEHDLETQKFWIARFRPLWEKRYQDRGDTQRQTTVLICNRTGTEKGSTFAGTSTLLRSTSGAPGPEIVDMLTRREETLKVWEIGA